MASLRRIRRRACEGKYRHASKDEAWTAISNINHSRKTNSHMRPYKCEWCGSYHAGHPPKKNGQRRRIKLWQL